MKSVETSSNGPAPAAVGLADAAGSTPAAKTTAASKPLTVSSYAVNPSSKVVTSKGNQNFRLYIGGKLNASNVAAYTVKVPLWRGKKFVKSVYIKNTSSQSFALSPKSSKTHYGRFTFKPARVYIRYTNGKRVDYKVNVYKNFYMKGGISGNLNIARTGNKHHFYFTTKYFSGTKQKYVAYSPKNARLQYKSGGSWKNYGGKLKIKNGKWSSYKNISGRHTWRISVPTASQIVGGRTSAISI